MFPPVAYAPTEGTQYATANLNLSFLPILQRKINDFEEKKKFQDFSQFLALRYQKEMLMKS